MKYVDIAILDFNRFNQENQMNTVMFVGTVSSQPQVRNLQQGSVMNFKVVETVGYGQNKKQNEFGVTHFLKGQSKLPQYLTVGKLIGVSGSLEQQQWTDQQGNPKSFVAIKAYNIQLMGGNSGGGQDMAGQEDQTQNNYPQQPQQPAQQPQQGPGNAQAYNPAPQNAPYNAGQPAAPQGPAPIDDGNNGLWG